MNATYTIRYTHTGAVRYEKAAGWTREIAGVLNTALLIMTAPLLGLAFVIALPLAGLAVLAWMFVKAAARRRATVAAVMKRTALFFAAPFVGLVYFVTFPFVAAVMLLYYAVRKAPR